VIVVGGEWKCHPDKWQRVKRPLATQHVPMQVSLAGVVASGVGNPQLQLRNDVPAAASAPDEGDIAKVVTRTGNSAFDCFVVEAKEMMALRIKELERDCVDPKAGEDFTTEPMGLQVSVPLLPTSTPKKQNAVVARAPGDEKGGFVDCSAFLALRNDSSQSKFELLRDGVWNSLPVLQDNMGYVKSISVVRGALQFLGLLCNKRICASCDEVAKSSFSSPVIAILCLGLAYASDEVHRIDILECSRRVDKSAVNKFEWILFCAFLGHPSCRP
jgi:hypothetical protein